MHGVTGWLFPLEREGALGECLARLAADEPARRAMGERARERALERLLVGARRAGLCRAAAAAGGSRGIAPAETRKCPS